ncbi:reduced folate transporter isoform X3 [Pipistrellus kuhlii]|uniref:reduced folate transporter isoform X3 n=1 Tax=Pipistrellus kuhlii TaxID=59472 RepID=UPI001E273DBB|nr:reduced folate transporter isoform X3 [Pipistrellus kuhlii]
MASSSQRVEKPGTLEPQPEPGSGRELQSCRWLVFYLCFYGFMAQMRPGESFITPYLLGPKNFTKEQVTNEITPVLSYSYLAVLVPTFLLTDYLRYKPVLLLQGLSYISVWLLLLFGHSVLHMQFMEFFYSLTMAARIAYSSYIFSLVRPAQYQRMAGYSRSSVLLGVFTSSVLGQLLVTAGEVTFQTLNYISLAFLTFSLILAMFLKRPKRSMFFNRSEPAHGEASPSELDKMRPGPGQPMGRKLPRTLLAGWRDWVLVRMLRELGASLRLPQLRLWSLWWVFNSSGYYLIVFYVHILWNVVDPTKDTTKVYNGGVDAASTLLGAITSFTAGFVKIRWALWAKLIIGGVTAVQAALIFLMYSTSSIWVCYVSYVLFRGFYQFLVPIAMSSVPWSSESTRSLPLFSRPSSPSSFLTSGAWASRSIPRQFLVYFGYFVVLSVAYFLGAVLGTLWHFLGSHHRPLPLGQELRSPSEEKATQVLSLQDGALSSLQPEATTLAPEDSAWAAAPVPRDQSEAKA